MTSIGSEHLLRFERDGFVIVPGMMAPARLAEINRVALRELMHNTGHSPQRLTIAPELVVRRSTAPPPRRRLGGEALR